MPDTTAFRRERSRREVLFHGHPASQALCLGEAEHDGGAQGKRKVLTSRHPGNFLLPHPTSRRFCHHTTAPEAGPLRLQIQIRVDILFHKGLGQVLANFCYFPMGSSYSLGKSLYFTHTYNYITIYIYVIYNHWEHLFMVLAFLIKNEKPSCETKEVPKCKAKRPDRTTKEHQRKWKWNQV